MISITNNDNYLAEVVRLDTFTKHPNADRLRVWNIHGYEVITDLSREPGDVCVFFQIETQISNEILKKLNMYSDKEFNEDKTQTGYINSQGRVKAVKLRGWVSEGMLLPANEVFGAVQNDNLELPSSWSSFIGQKFDTINDKVICNKYVPAQVFGGRQITGDSKVKRPKVNEFLIPGQFNLHYNTSKLQDNAWRFQDETDKIVITDKWHGTSAVFSNVLTKRKLSWWEKTRKFLGANIKTTEYSPMYSSRTVVKSIDGKYNVPDRGYYNSDIWGKVFEDLKPVLFMGYTLYGEIVGYTGDKMIQKSYHYGCKPGEHKFLIYRITETSKNGIIEEYSWEDVKDFCKEHNLQHVPELYYGTIHDFYIVGRSFGDTHLPEHSPQLFLDILKGEYLEKTCNHNNNKVPSEGICIRNESGNRIAYKLKSKLFLEKESKDLDTATEVNE